MLERRHGCKLFEEKKGKILNGKMNKPFDIFQ